MSRADLVVQKNNPRQANWKDRDAAPLQPGQARLKIDTLALTANNVTYAVFADFAGYWEHFPSGEDTTGRVPHWGFAEVEETTLDALPVGTRVYGYLPVSSDLVIQPDRFDPTGFIDASPWRAELPSFYNRFHLTASDPAYIGEFENEQMLVRPLYATGWLIDDFLMQRDTPPVQVIVSSASSKTALAFAHKAKDRPGLVLTALTSDRNVDFVRDTGFYTHVLSYDQLADIPRQGPTLYTDFLGDPALRPKLHAALGDHFAGTVMIGATAWDASRTTPPGVDDAGDPPTEMFLCARARRGLRQTHGTGGIFHGDEHGHDRLLSGRTGADPVALHFWP